MAGHGGSTDWFLAQLKPNSNQIALRNLERQGFDCFLPLCEQTRRRNSRFVATLQPLFPGYLFVGCTEISADVSAINGTLGIARLVRFGDNAAVSVPSDLVAELKRRCDANNKLMPIAGLHAGDSVKITQGPFADFVARVEGAAPDQRVWVLLELMGRETRLALRTDSVQLS